MDNELRWFQKPQILLLARELHGVELWFHQRHLARVIDALIGPRYFGHVTVFISALHDALCNHGIPHDGLLVFPHLVDVARHDHN